VWKKILRVIIRTSLSDYRCMVGLPENWKHNSRMNKGVLKALKESHPSIRNIKFVLIPNNEVIYKDLLKFETTQVISKAKFGVVLRLDGQNKEEELFSNEKNTPRFEEFLNFLGDRITLKGHEGFTGGLDVKSNSTGIHSVFTKIFGLDIMFHISTFLPHSTHDSQQVEVKRHIGNDIITIIFNDSSKPFSPQTITSEFSHIFCVIQPVETLCTAGSTYYKVAIACKKGVPPFGPLLPLPAIFKKDSEFREFLFAKLINGECAALECPSFSKKLQRTRTLLLNEVIKKHQKKK